MLQESYFFQKNIFMKKNVEQSLKRKGLKNVITNNI